KLADRLDDIPPLADYFIEKYSKANGMPSRKLTGAAIEKLRGHSWHGNVRELENIIHRAVLMGQGNSIDENAILLPTRKHATGAKSARMRQYALFGTGPCDRNADVPRPCCRSAG